ncbi:hypothetical protein DPEC_G00164960 [Dallia pectoralis]|uniref:Uncharacterized protein n=1 Tax=Dallia pectoralis TaxID=75939 RepID=A0ACC2GGZ7_DALPE|nr:hypothetical protein DPEC_G00164960 [Dallia pectoralis]
MTTDLRLMLPHQEPGMRGEIRRATPHWQPHPAPSSCYVSWPPTAGNPQVKRLRRKKTQQSTNGRQSPCQRPGRQYHSSLTHQRGSALHDTEFCGGSVGLRRTNKERCRLRPRREKVHILAALLNSAFCTS